MRSIPFPPDRFVVGILGLLVLPILSQVSACSTEDPLTQFVGDYGQPDADSDTVVTFTARNGELLMGPALWSGPMVLRQIDADSFVVPPHPRFGVRFMPAENGRRSIARIYGLSANAEFVSLADQEPRAIQLLESGKPVEAAKRFASANPDDVDRFVAIGQRLLRSSPTTIGQTTAYLEALARLLPEASAIYATLGDAYVASGNRGRATDAYRHALTIDPHNEQATVALTRLGALSVESSSGWTLPFPLDSLFAPPTAAEIRAVRSAWTARDLAPDHPRIVRREPISLDGRPAEARIIEHSVHGSRHVGVVVVPVGIGNEKLPVLVETKGVSPTFFPLEVPAGLTSPLMLGDLRDRVVYVLPGYRGERVIVGADTLVSEGDRSDAWDGATDDTIALLRVALDVTPEADSSRVCAFGRSRGGAVALLAGMREPLIDCVVSWAAPTDWFSAMDLDGWTQSELVRDGLRNRSQPGATGGQFINYFLRDAISGKANLETTRLHLIASSPLYFADLLPLTQVHWGLDDTIVPSINGKLFAARYSQSGGSPDCLDVHLHPGSGHDQDRQLAPLQSRRFIADALAADDTALDSCRKRSD